MGPGHSEAGQECLEDDREQRACEGAVDGANAEVEEEAIDNVIDNGETKTTEATPWAGFTTKVPDGLTDAGGDGLSLH